MPTKQIQRFIRNDNPKRVLSKPYCRVSVVKGAMLAAGYGHDTGADHSRNIENRIPIANKPNILVRKAIKFLGVADLE